MASTLSKRSRSLLVYQSFGIHSVAVSPIQATRNETSVLVYNSPDYESFAKASESGRWNDEIVRTQNKSKFFSLIPFFVESRITSKYFVLRMEAFPESKFLKLHILRLGGVFELYVPLSEMVPITPYDYWCVSWVLFFKQNQCIDLDMIYGNHVTKEMYVFDKNGEWKDEGVYHDGLSLEKTYNETNWYDEFNAHNF